jgi:hypothetical protein
MQAVVFLLALAAFICGLVRLFVADGRITAAGVMCLSIIVLITIFPGGFGE